ncbi:MAG: hypothetical protein LBU55_00255 [Elusimicrobiota bacterium]|jgi:tetratricopeptide (TPR) repeat protein|nr:hypothetical protein [Elusimicrobiota bacterium]
MKLALNFFILFIAGLAISGVLWDFIGLVKILAIRIYTAVEVSSAEKLTAQENYLKAAAKYEKSLPHIKEDNKKLLAKVKNNLGLCYFYLYEKERRDEFKQKSILFFEQALALYEETKSTIAAQETMKNLQNAKKLLEF